MKNLKQTLLVALMLLVFQIGIFAEGDIHMPRTCTHPPTAECPGNGGGFAQQQPEISIFTKILLEIGKIVIFR